MIEFHQRSCDRRARIAYNTCQGCGGAIYPTIFADPSEVNYTPGWLDDSMLREALAILWHNVLTVIALAAATDLGFFAGALDDEEVRPIA